MQVSGVVQLNPDNKINQGAPRQETPFSGYRSGDSVQAEVVNVKGDQVTLRTQDGTEIVTKFAAGSVVNAGDTVELMLTERSGQTVFLKLSAINGQPVNLESSEMQVFLMRMGVPPSSMNQSAAQLLAQYNIRPTPQNMAALVEIATSFPQLQTSVAVFMADNKIPPTQQNVDAILQWLSDHGSLDKDITQLAQLVQQDNRLAEPSASSAPQTGEAVTVDGKTVQTMNLPVAEALIQMVTSDGRLPQSPQMSALLQSQPFLELAAQLPAMGEQEAAQAIQDFVQQTNLTPKEQEALQTVLKDAYTAVKQQQEGQAEGATRSQPESVQRAESREPAQQTQAGQPTAAKGEAVLRETAQNPQAPQTAQAVVNEEAHQVLQTLEKLFTAVKTGRPVEGANIEQAVKNQPVITELARNSIARVTGENSPAANKAGELTAQMRVANQIDNFYYCQIPLEMDHGKNTAELYVFEKKKNAAGETRDNITVLIALETQNIGRIETVLRAQTEKLSVEFRVENDRIGSYLRESAEEFTEAMRESGFEIETVTVQQMREPVTPLNAKEILRQSDEIDLKGIDIQI